MEERFTAASPQAVYELLMDPQRMSMVTGGATIEHKPQGKFMLFNGAVTGEFVDLVRDSRIVERWRFSSWPAGHYSLVTIDIGSKAGETVLKLTQVGVPREDIGRTEAGWRDNIWSRIRGMFGFGGNSSSADS
jgi:activator of HSP90 ATPase